MGGVEEQEKERKRKGGCGSRDGVGVEGKVGEWEEDLEEGEEVRVDESEWKREGERERQ